MQYINEHHNYENCVFCTAARLEDGFENLIVERGENAFVILNRYPYNNGHLLVVPYKHCDSLDALSVETRNEIMTLTNSAIKILRVLYNPQGFNIGINIGDVAGAGLAEHIHLHVVPRWGGDTNFMSIIGQTRVLPEELAETYQRIFEAWRAG